MYIVKQKYLVIRFSSFLGKILCKKFYHYKINVTDFFNKNKTNCSTTITQV